MTSRQEQQQGNSKGENHRRHRRHNALSRLYGLICLVAVPLLTACDADNSVYRGYECRFIFDTALHPLPCHLTGILGNPGHFCKIELTTEAGIRHLKTTRNYDGATDDIAITTERERQQTCVLGAAGTIIIGTASYDARLMAYEGQCPNCLTDLGGTRYPLAWEKNGLWLRCAKCQRAYDVNNGVVTDGDGGRQLFTYNAAYDGQVLRAWN